MIMKEKERVQLCGVTVYCVPERIKDILDMRRINLFKCSGYETFNSLRIPLSLPPSPIFLLSSLFLPLSLLTLWLPNSRRPRGRDNPPFRDKGYSGDGKGEKERGFGHEGER